MTGRWQFRESFGGAGPAVLPVIHVLDVEQACRNAEVAVSAGAAGVFLINHDFPKHQLLPVIRAVRARWPALWLGVNFLAVTGGDAFPILGRLQAEGCPVDAYWADDACIDEREDKQTEAMEIARIRAGSGWTGLYFGGVAFKKQRPVEPAQYRRSAEIARPFMDVVTTSGIATGHAAEAGKIIDFRAGLGEAPLALASGVTPENATRYGRDADCFLVATGINRAGDFYNIDPARLDALLAVTRNMGAEP
ncbi:MAG: adenine phosphoribosyltransferase [Paracoccaceae bacterium]